MADSPSTSAQNALRLARFCGALPLGVGILIFLLWLLTRLEALMVAGLITLLVGSLSFLIGIVALGRFLWLSSRATVVPRSQLWRPAAYATGLLFANFLIAAGIVYAAIAIETRYTVVVRNQSNQALKSVRVEGGGCVADFGTIASDGTASRGFWIERDGQLHLSAEVGTNELATVIDGYVSPSMGGRTVVSVDTGGKITFTNLSR